MQSYITRLSRFFATNPERVKDWQETVTNIESNYSNFQDPSGLAYRMLTQAPRESIGPLIQMGCEVAAKPLNHFASRWESFQDRDYDIPQVLVLGLPRTGTTMISQVFAQYLDVSYFPNVSAMFPSAPIWATQRFAGDFSTAPKTTRNFFGSTAGHLGINDGFHIWNRWFGANRYAIEHGPSDDEVEEMQTFFATWNGVFGKPLLNKNNRNVDGIELLAEILPNAVFVVVDRDPRMTVQSLLLARKFVQGADSKGWGLFSNHSQGESNPIRSVCEQVAFGIRRLENQLSKIQTTHNILRLSYEAFCESPQINVEEAAKSHAALRLRPCLELRSMPDLQASDKIRLPTKDWDRIEREFEIAI